MTRSGLRVAAPPRFSLILPGRRFGSAAYPPTAPALRRGQFRDASPLGEPREDLPPRWIREGKKRVIFIDLFHSHPLAGKHLTDVDCATLIDLRHQDMQPGERRFTIISSDGLRAGGTTCVARWFGKHCGTLRI